MISKSTLPERLPLFPLRQPLFPGHRLSLKLFEPRYINLLARCMKQSEGFSQGFGIVALERGAEVGDDQQVHSYGTRADVVDWNQLSNGLLGVEVVASERFRLVEAPVREHGILISPVEWLADDSTPVPESMLGLVELLNELQQHPLAQTYGPMGFASDAENLSWRLGQLSPLPVSTQSTLLAEVDPLERLSLLSAEIDRLAGR